MTWSMQPNGTISHWKGADGIDILFPETEFLFGIEKKLRGGAPVCCPNFGTAPNDGPYAGVQLPQHGLVRTSQMIGGRPAPGNRAMHQSPPTLNEDGWISSNYHFMAPWIHEVWVSAKTELATKDRVQCMHHSILLRTEAIHEVRMPYSIGFHPYFATAGGAFSLHHGDRHWTVYNLDVDTPFFVPLQDDGAFFIDTFNGTTELKLNKGYNGFFVWTDRFDLYICVEPVCIGDGRRYRMLDVGEEVRCACTMTFTPRT